MATIDKLNTVSMTGINKVDTISLSTIEEINTIAVPAGFTTDYSVELNGTSQYINLGDQRNTSLNPSQSSINSTGFTLTAWIYLDVLASPTDYIFDLGNCCSNSYYGLKWGLTQMEL